MVSATRNELASMVFVGLPLPEVGMNAPSVT